MSNRQNVWNSEKECFELVDGYQGVMDEYTRQCAVDSACICGSKSFYNKNDARYCVRCDTIQLEALCPKCGLPLVTGLGCIDCDRN